MDAPSAQDNSRIWATPTTQRDLPSYFPGRPQYADIPKPTSHLVSFHGRPWPCASNRRPISRYIRYLRHTSPTFYLSSHPEAHWHTRRFPSRQLHLSTCVHLRAILV